MANQDWYDLGDNLKNIVQDAIDSKNFNKLNQTIKSTINDTVQNVGDTIRQATNQAKENDNRSSTFAYGHPHTERPKKTQSSSSHPSVYAKKSSAGGLVLSILGYVFSGVFGFTLFILFIAGIFTHRLMQPGMLISLCIMIPLFLGGIVMAYIGTKDRSRAKRFKLYLRYLKDKTYCNLKELENAIGKSHNYILKDLKDMIHRGWFHEGHIDEQETCLITSNITYQEYLKTQQYRKAQETQEKEMRAAQSEMPADVKEIIQTGNQYLKQIHDSNDSIPGKEISDKISRMELIIQKIFQRVAQHPEVIPELRKLMEYYLPTTIKLLDAYEELDVQPIQGEHILTSKQEIEKTIDTLNLAFEKLLDSLFKDAAWDLSSDISVLHTMLAQEGLTKDDF